MKIIYKVRFIIILLATIFCTNSTNAQTQAEIGIRTLTDHNQTYIVDVIKNSPSAQQGILSGSRLYKINNINLKNCTPHEIINLLLGEPNSNVIITINSYGKKKTFTIERKILSYSKNRNNESIYYWKQIAPSYFNDCILLAENENYPRNIKRFIYANNYWANRKIAFEDMYKFYVSKDKKSFNDYFNNQLHKKGQPKGQEWFIRMAEQLSYYNSQLN